MDKFAWGNISGFFYLLLGVFAGIFFYLGSRWRRRKLLQLASSHLIPVLVPEIMENARNLKFLFLLLTFFFGTLALMEPKYDYSWETIKREGIDLLLALDTSKSMYANDIPPSRFERSKLEIKNLLNSLEGDRVGLIIFSSVALTQCPLTLDYATLKLFLDEVEIGTLSRGGTSLSSAIEQAILSFDKRYKKERILVVVTDGESHDENRLEKTLEKAKTAGIKIFTVGLGSKTGVPIFLPGETGEKKYVKDSEGNIVLSRLEDEDLKKCALLTGGAYVQAEAGGFNLASLYQEKIAPLEGRELETKRKKRYEDRFYIPLGLALFFLLAEAFLKESRRKNEPKHSGFQKK